MCAEPAARAGCPRAELAGITGQVRIEILPEGGHRLALDYELG